MIRMEMVRAITRSSVYKVVGWYVIMCHVLHDDLHYEFKGRSSNYIDICATSSQLDSGYDLYPRTHSDVALFMFAVPSVICISVCLVIHHHCCPSSASGIPRKIPSHILPTPIARLPISSSRRAWST